MLSHEEVEYLTSDAVGEYTEAEIDRLIQVQAHLDNFSYTPVSSADTSHKDDGSDSLFFYQSNLPQILRLLNQQYQHIDWDDDSDDEEGDTDEARRRRDQKAKIAKLKTDMHNNSKVADDKKHAVQLLAMLQAYRASAKGDDHPRGIVEATVTHSVALEIDTSADAATSLIEGVGPLEGQIEMFQRIARYKSDQVNHLKTMLSMAVEVLEDALFEMSNMTTKAAGDEDLRNSEMVHDLESVNADLLREQEYLYYRLYGPKHKTDAKAERQKKYRRDVDEAYKQMVDADVAKKVTKAAKNSDAWVKKTQAEVDVFRKMMKNSHLQLCDIAQIGRMSMRANQSHERYWLGLEDKQAWAERTEELMSTAASIASTSLSRDASVKKPISKKKLPDRIVPADVENDVSEIFDMGGPEEEGGSVLSLSRVTNRLIRTIEAAVSQELAASTMKVADEVGSHRLGTAAYEQYSCALGNAASAAKSLLMSTAANTLAVASALPHGMGIAVARQSAHDFLERLPAIVSQTLNQFAVNLVNGEDPFNTEEALRYAMRRHEDHRAYVDGLGIKERSAQTDLSGSVSGGGGAALDIGGGTLSPALSSAGDVTPSSGTKNKSAVSPSAKGLSPGKHATFHDGDDGSSSTSAATKGGRVSRMNSSLRSHRDDDTHSTTSGVSTATAAGDGKKSLKGAASTVISGRRATQALSAGTGAATKVGGKKPGGKRRPSMISNASAMSSSSQQKHQQLAADDDTASHVSSLATTVASVETKLTSPTSREVGTMTVRQRAQTRNAVCQVTILNDANAARPQDQEMAAIAGVRTTLTGLGPLRRPPGSKKTPSVTPLHDLDILDEKNNQQRPSSGQSTGASPSAMPDLALDGAARGRDSSPDDGVSPHSHTSTQDAAAAGMMHQLPPLVAPIEGPQAIVYVGIDNAHSFWESCADTMPSLLAVYLQLLRDGLRSFDGHVAKSEGDALCAVFSDMGDAVGWCLSMQRHMLDLPYSKGILSHHNGLAIKNHSEETEHQYIWRGFRVRMGIHFGVPDITIHEIERRIDYDGVAMTVACRVAMMAAGGQVMCSADASHQLELLLEDFENIEIRHQAEMPWIDGSTQAVNDIVDDLLVMRPYKNHMNRSSADSPPASGGNGGGGAQNQVNSKDGAVGGGVLYQWLCALSALHDVDSRNCFSFAFVEVQSEIDFLDYSTSAINKAAEAVTAAVVETAETNNGTIAKTRGFSLMVVFTRAKDAALFAMAVQAKAMQLNYPKEVLMIPECREVYSPEDAMLCWRGLKVRCALHYGNVERAKHNRYTNATDYYGSDVAFGATFASTARFGESILSASMYAMMDATAGLWAALGDPIVKPISNARTAEGELLEAYNIFPPILKSRPMSLETSKSFFRTIVDPEESKLAGADASPAGGLLSPNIHNNNATEMIEYELDETTAVLSISIDGIADMIDAYPRDLEVALNLYLSLARSLLTQYDGIEASMESLTLTCLFREPQNAVLTALNLQAKAMHLPVPQNIINFSGEVRDEQENDLLFRGLRLAMCVHLGEIHEYRGSSGGNKSSRSYYGSAITQARYLSSAYACGGETLLTATVMSALEADEAHTGFLQRINTYRIENVLLPGDHKRTGLYGGVLEELRVRRRHFSRAKKSSASNKLQQQQQQQGADAAVELASAANKNKKLNNRYAFDQDGALKYSASGAGGGRAGSAGSFAMVSSGGDNAIGGGGSGSGMISGVRTLEGGGEVAYDFDTDPHRCNAAILQRVYRGSWKVASKAGKVMGFPVEVDADPVMFDAALREAITIGTETSHDVLFEAENTILERLEAMLSGCLMALNCARDKGVYFHRSAQSAIIIPPFDQKDDQLYVKDVDVGPGKTVYLDDEAGGAQDRPVNKYDISAQLESAMKRRGFRPGIGADVTAVRLKERRVMDLERDIMRLEEESSQQESQHHRQLMMISQNQSSIHQSSQSQSPEQQQQLRNRMLLLSNLVVADDGSSSKLVADDRCVESVEGSQQGAGQRQHRVGSRDAGTGARADEEVDFSVHFAGGKPPPSSSSPTKNVVSNINNSNTSRALVSSSSTTRPSGASRTTQRKHWRKQPPLSSLQTQYQPDGALGDTSSPGALDQLCMVGETSSDAVLVAPFSNMVGVPSTTASHDPSSFHQHLRAQTPSPSLALATTAGGGGAGSNKHHHVGGRLLHTPHVARTPVERVRNLRPSSRALLEGGDPSSASAVVKPGTMPFYIAKQKKKAQTPTATLSYSKKTSTNTNTGGGGAGILPRMAARGPHAGNNNDVDYHDGGGRWEGDGFEADPFPSGPPGGGGGGYSDDDDVQ